MATLQELERALVNADRAGDMDAARKLAVVVAKARQDPVSRIPDIPIEGTEERPPEPTVGEQIVGAGETALALGTGAVGGTVGMIGGTLKGLAEQILSGQFGTQEAARLVEEQAVKGAQALTYAPRTRAGQEQAGALGEALAETIPLGPLTAETGIVAQAARAARPTVTAAAQRAAAPVRQVAQRVVQAADEALRPEAPATGAQAATQAAEEIGALTRKASARGFGSQAARDRLAELAQVNPEAKAAADRLGIELPFDVFSDNPQVRAAVGLTRSAAGTEAEAAWRTAVSKAVDKADENIRQFDAAFVEGTVSPGVVSQKIRDSLTKTRSELNAQATRIYEQVDAAVPKQSVVEFPKLKETLSSIVAEVGEGGLSSPERKLMSMIEQSNVTYGRLIREKNLIGKAIQGKDSPYGNMEAGALKRLYAALADDQLTNVGRIGGEELRSQLRGANLIYAKERALGKRIVNAFGEDVDGSIANKMRSAITSAAKGESTEFNKLLKLVPEDLRKETIATALASITRSSRGAERGGFGFAEYAKTYQGLRANAPIYAKVVEILGPESHQVMRDLYEVSKRVTDARANVLTTGKANQALLESLNAESLIGKVIDSTVGKAAATGAAAIGGGAVGAAASSVIINALTKGNKSAIKAAGELFASDEFQKLAIEAATKPEVSASAVRRLSMSTFFRKFADAIKLPLRDREQWIKDAIRPPQEQQSVQAQPLTEGVK